MLLASDTLTTELVVGHVGLEGGVVEIGEVAGCLDNADSVAPPKREKCRVKGENYNKGLFRKRSADGTHLVHIEGVMSDTKDRERQILQMNDKNGAHQQIWK